MGMSVCVPNLKIVRADGGRGGRQLRYTEHIYINNRAVKKYIIHRVFYLQRINIFNIILDTHNLYGILKA
jgi:hypothetical protein